MNVLNPRRLLQARRKEDAPLAPAPEVDTLEGQLFSSIENLRPHIPGDTSRFAYRSQALASKLLEMGANPNLVHLIEPLQFSPDDTISVALNAPPADPTDGEGKITLYNGLKGYVTVRFDQTYQATGVDRMKGQNGVPRPMDRGILTNIDPKYLQDILTVMKGDLEDGRKRWIDSLQEAQQNYISQLENTHGQWGQALVLNFMTRYRSAFQNANRYLVFGMPLEEANDGEKKPVIRLFSTLPIDRSVADTITHSYAIHMPSNTTAEHRKRYWNQLSSETYEEQTHGTTLVVESTLPPEFSLSDSSRLRDGTFLEGQFADFLAGPTPRISGDKRPTLLMVHPSKTQSGHLYFEL